MTKSLTLEAALARLEEIVGQMGGEITLDESLKLYEESVKLVDLIGKKLDAARLKVEKLSGEKQNEQV